MYVRLAFAVAAHLEPEIMLVDEVLAVGDAAFQKKCLGKMKDVASKDRTILFVSHNMGAIRNLCKRVILIDEGRLVEDGAPDHVIAKYLDSNLLEGAVASADEITKRMEGVILRDRPFLRFERIAITGAGGQPKRIFHSDEEIGISVTFRCLQQVKSLWLIISIADEDATPLMATQSVDDAGVNSAWPNYEAGVYTANIRIPPNTFGGRRFFINVDLLYPKTEHLVLRKILEFEIKFRNYENQGGGDNIYFRPKLQWMIQQEKKGC